MGAKQPKDDDRKLLSDEEFAEHIDKEFAAASPEERSEQQQRADRQRQHLQATLDRTDPQDRVEQRAGSSSPGSPRWLKLAAAVMLASTVLAGYLIHDALQPSEAETLAVKGTGSGTPGSAEPAHRVLDITLSSPQPATARVVVTSKEPGWLAVYIRSGDKIVPWLAEFNLHQGDNPIFAIDHPLPVGGLWPKVDQDHSQHNVCGVAVTHRSALVTMAANIKKLWGSFSAQNCLYTP